MTDHLTAEDIATINAARAVLSAKREHDYNARPDVVRAAVMAGVAEDALFDYLNICNAYLRVHMTHEQLHLTAAPVVSA